MSTEENKRGFTRVEGPNDSIAASSNTPSTVQNVRLDDITTGSITGPLVIFYGPREIGKTVTLWRLISYIRGFFNISPNRIFRRDTGYKETVDKFQNTLSDASRLAPDATGNINFLLMDIIDAKAMRTTCQILEAPGEHFFDAENPEAQYPSYLETIFTASYRKVYVFFFAIGMFQEDEMMRKYCDKIVQLINTRLDSSRDKIIVVCNKCDQQPWMMNSKPIWDQYKAALIDAPAFSNLKEVISGSRFINVPFVPFMSGRFKDIEGSEKRAVAPSPDYYPQTLWNEIFNAVHGIFPQKEGWLSRLLRFIGF